MVNRGLPGEAQIFLMLCQDLGNDLAVVAGLPRSGLEGTLIPFEVVKGLGGEDEEAGNVLHR